MQSTIDPLESRQLMAAERLDTSFGVNGHVALPTYVTLNSMLATHGSIYVDVYNYKKDRRLIYKYTDAGVLDTAWGSGGYIVTHAVTTTKDSAGQYSPVTMVYDARTKGLVVGFADGDVIDFERRNADGSFDTSWGSGGMLEYHLHGATITLDRITPLVGKQMLVAFDSSESTSRTSSGTTRTTGIYAVSLMRLDRRGRFDKTFAGDGIANIALGTLKTLDTPSSDQTGTLASDTNQPSFQDVQVQADGSYQVVTTSQLKSSVAYYDHGFDAQIGNTKSGRQVSSAAVLSVSTAGKVKVQQSYTLQTERYTDQQASYSGYVPKLARKGSDGTLTVLGQTNFSSISVIKLAGTTRTSSSLPIGGTYVFDIIDNNPGGLIFIETTGSGYPTVGRFDSALNLQTGFGVNGTYSETTGYILHAGDDDGRLVVGNSAGPELRRLV